MPADPLTDIRAGSGVFVDANVFVYALQGQSRQCQDLLRRCAREDIFGVTTFDVVAEVTHRLMLAEAVSEGIISNKDPVRKLQEKPGKVTRLSRYWAQAESIFRMNIVLLGTNAERHRQAHLVRSRSGLLTNDSLVVAAMREYGLALLASADQHFDRVDGVARYAPTDLPA